MDKERTAIRLEILGLACSKKNDPDGILALAKVLEEYVIQEDDKVTASKRRITPTLKVPD